MGFNGMLPSGNDCYIAIENDPVEIVSFPINSMVMFHTYVNFYQVVFFTIKHVDLTVQKWCIYFICPIGYRVIWESPPPKTEI